MIGDFNNNSLRVLVKKFQNNIKLTKENVFRFNTQTPANVSPEDYFDAALHFLISIAARKYDLDILVGNKSVIKQTILVSNDLWKMKFDDYKKPFLTGHLGKYKFLDIFISDIIPETDRSLYLISSDWESKVDAHIIQLVEK